MSLVFCSTCENDLYCVLSASGKDYPRYDTPREAIEKARSGDGVLILADAYPATRTEISEELFQLAEQKRLKLLVEFPSFVPGQEAGEVRRCHWERAVVSAPDFGDTLKNLTILAVHDCRFVAMRAADPLLVIARVAGYDKAVFGLPEETWPLLFRAKDNVLVITSRLSGFVSGRFAPAGAWKTIWEYLLKQLGEGTALDLRWTPVIGPIYGPKDSLPADVETAALARVAEWYDRSRLLLSEERFAGIAGGDEDISDDTIDLPGENEPVGDGTYGVLEGYSSNIRYDGAQYKQRVPLRGDCNCESAMVLMLDWMVRKRERSRRIAENLLDYVYFRSNMHTGVRDDPNHPAFGLKAWGDGGWGDRKSLAGWLKRTYPDDEARGLIATMIAAACLKTDKWDSVMLKEILATHRLYGLLSFTTLEGAWDIPDLEKHGWRYYHDQPTFHTCTERDPYMWACFLWAYHHTGYKPLLETARLGIKLVMALRSERPWTDGGDFTRMILALAWLVRAEDTPEHRGFLKRATDYLLNLQQPCGAIREHNECRTRMDGCYPLKSNEAYGTDEASLIQENGDPVCDHLYCTGFAMLGLHEAAAVTGDPKLRDAADRLAKFQCRIQIRSERYPYLSGMWFRAFDYRMWEYWGSSADLGWGAWSIEAGWGQAWTPAILGLRALGVSIWDLTAKTKIKSQFEEVLRLMAMNDGGPYTE